MKRLTDTYDLSLYILTLYEEIIAELIQTAQHDNDFKGMVADNGLQKVFNVKPKEALNLLSKLKSLLEAVRFEIAQKKETEPI